VFAFKKKKNNNKTHTHTQTTPPTPHQKKTNKKTTTTNKQKFFVFINIPPHDVDMAENICVRNAGSKKVVNFVQYTCRAQLLKINDGSLQILSLNSC
jgi:hypothetical protein